MSTLIFFDTCFSLLFVDQLKTQEKDYKKDNIYFYCHLTVAESLGVLEVLP